MKNHVFRLWIKRQLRKKLKIKWATDIIACQTHAKCMEVKKMKIALYSRVSTEEQAREGTSLEVQREYLESFAKREGHKVYKHYEDDGISGSTLNRPALQQLLKDAKHKKFDAIFVYKIDRFARNNRILLNLVEELDNLDIGFKSATEFFDTVSASGKMALSMLGTVAQFERDRIIERVFPGMIKGAMQGNWQGARYAPFGYTYNKAKKLLEVEKRETDVVKLIYEMYIEGKSTLRIAGYLNKKGYKSRTGGKFHTKLLGDILKNQVYLGKIVWNRHHYDAKQKTSRGCKYVKNPTSKIIIAKGRHKSIITQEQFDKVQKILKKRRKKIMPRANSRDYLLTGLIECGLCSHRYQGCAAAISRKNKKTIKKRRYYRCSGSTAFDTKCKNLYLRADDIERDIFRLIEVIANTPFVEDFLVKKVEKDMLISNSKLENEFNKITKMLNNNISMQKKLINHNLAGLMADEVYREKSLELKDEEREIRNKITSVKQRVIEKHNSINYKQMVIDLIKRFDNIKNNLSVMDKKMLLRIVIKKIIVVNRKVKTIELYEPFKSLYKEGKKLWETKPRRGSVSICEPSAVR